MALFFCVWSFPRSLRPIPDPTTPLPPSFPHPLIPEKGGDPIASSGSAPQYQQPVVAGMAAWHDNFTSVIEE